jgi:hypothetical protein
VNVSSHNHQFPLWIFCCCGNNNFITDFLQSILIVLKVESVKSRYCDNTPQIIMLEDPDAH